MTKESLPVWLTGFIEQETFYISCTHYEHRGSFKDVSRVSSILLLLFLLPFFFLLISPLFRILCFFVLSILSSSSYCCHHEWWAEQSYRKSPKWYFAFWWRHLVLGSKFYGENIYALFLQPGSSRMRALSIFLVPHTFLPSHFILFKAQYIGFNDVVTF